MEGSIRIPAGAASGVADLPPENALADTGGPTPADVTDALDGSLAGRLRAKAAEIQRGTREFPVPGWDGELVIEARVIRDEKQLNRGMRNEDFILETTTKVLARDEDGTMRDVGGWRGVARLMGQEDASLGQVVRGVLDNPLRLDAFATDLIAWMTGRRSALEQALGE